MKFYQLIDVQVVWTTSQHVWKFPLKIINAASFGIATIAFPNTGYEEMEGKYLKAKDMSEVKESINLLKNKEHYNMWSEYICTPVEPYHIDSVAVKYKELPS